MAYRPNAIFELRTPVKLLIPTVTKYNGVTTKTFPEDSDILLFVNWKTFGGTESVVNGVLSIIDTAEIVTWFRPDITPNARLKREDGKIYEIISEPENIDLGNQFCKFKVQRIKGGV